ncbi:hypothetical protein PC123_g27547 [Phytophthora cactorum]|nr:hypothetical protein PC123_g27547 [Phytophthora cactorum]
MVDTGVITKSRIMKFVNGSTLQSGGGTVGAAPALRLSLEDQTFAALLNTKMVP